MSRFVLGQTVIVSNVTPDAKILHAQEVARYARWKQCVELGQPFPGEQPKGPPASEPPRTSIVGIVTGFDDKGTALVHLLSSGQLVSDDDLQPSPSAPDAPFFHADSPIKSPEEVKATLNLTPSASDPPKP